MTYSRRELIAQRVDARAIELRTLRRALGLRIWELAAISGVAEAHIQRVETGRLRLTDYTFGRLIGALQKAAL